MLKCVSLKALQFCRVINQDKIKKYIYMSQISSHNVPVKNKPLSQLCCV